MTCHLALPLPLSPIFGARSRTKNAPFTCRETNTPPKKCVRRVDPVPEEYICTMVLIFMVLICTRIFFLFLKKIKKTKEVSNARIEVPIYHMKNWPNSFFVQNSLHLLEMSSYISLLFSFVLSIHNKQYSFRSRLYC